MPQEKRKVMMHRFLIERDIPGAGAMTSGQFCEAAAKSNAVLAELAPDVQWVQSYVTDDRLFCVYLAKNEDGVRKHAEASGFPATRIHQVSRVIDPITAEA
jgi:hypothetical protein